MRFVSLTAATAVAVALAASPAFACSNYGGCGYGAPAVAGVVPPLGWVYDYPQQVTQAYVVNRGPIYTGPGIYAYTNIWVPTLARPEYPYADYTFIQRPYPSYPHVPSYPYVRGAHGCGGYGGCGWRYGVAPFRDHPYGY